MKVYILKSDFGQREDGYDRTDGVYLDPVKAENAKREIEALMKEYKEMPCPFSDEELEYLTPEQEDEMQKWSLIHYDSREFNFCTIEEHDVIE